MCSVDAIVLMSGGLDSVVALAWALDSGHHIDSGISFTYGQRHIREIKAAGAVAEYFGVPHQVVDLAPIRGSKLTDLGDIPQGRDLGSTFEDLAATYVPNRNMILLSYAAAYALLGSTKKLIGGWNAADANNYPDCRDEFLEATQTTLKLATLREFEIVRPLIEDDKPAIVRKAIALYAPIELTWTCYLGGEKACGTCDACQLRVDAFQRVGIIDPVPYAIDMDWSGCHPYVRGGK